MRSTAQICDISQKIRLDLLHLLSYDSNHGEAWGGREQAKILILRGLKLRRFNQENHPFDIIKNDRNDNLSFFADFHEKLPTHICETYAITISEQIF